ncbi:hypothetical protein JCM10207_002258 [Rhodosporidiobolus poonsookiae]
MARTKTKTAPTPPAPPQQPLQWPAIPAQTRPLSLEQVSPGILVADSFFSPALRKTFISFLRANVKLQPPRPPGRGEAARTNERISFDAPDFAAKLWEDSGLREACAEIEGRNGKKAAGLNSNIRIYRYPEGSYFGPHYDDDFHDTKTGMTSEWTLLIYLTGKEDGVVGGETAFYPTPTRKDHGPAIVPELKAGRALLHRHGQLCALHEGRTVEKGEKWVLRSDVMFR